MRKSITLYGQEILSWLDNFRQNQRYPEKIYQKCWNFSTELRWKFKIELLNSFVLKICLQIVRDGSRTAATSKMQHFVIIVNCWRHSILDAAAVLYPPLIKVLWSYCQVNFVDGCRNDARIQTFSIHFANFINSKWINWESVWSFHWTRNVLELFIYIRWTVFIVISIFILIRS